MNDWIRCLKVEVGDGLCGHFFGVGWILGHLLSNFRISGSQTMPGYSKGSIKVSSKRRT